MKVFFIVEKKIYIKKYSHEINKICNLSLFYLEDKTWPEFIKKNKYDLVILYTNVIISRKQSYYKILKDYVNKKRVYFVEISHNKGKVETIKSISNCILQGLGILNWQFIKKIIKMKQNEI